MLLEILTSFETDGKALSAAELVEQTGLPRSSVFRGLKTLVEAGFIYQNPASKLYSLGPRILQLGMVARRELSSEELIAEPLLKLRNEIGETVTFSIFDFPGRMCAYVIEAPSDIRQVAQVGACYPLHLGAAGKVILAYLSDPVRASLMASENLSAAEKAKLGTELASIRTNGFALTTGERVQGASSVAAPVFVADSIYGSVAAAGPTDRALSVMQSSYATVIESARTLTERLSDPSGGFKSASHRAPKTSVTRNRRAPRRLSGAAAAE